jgi:serine phosphatase RsbU (regulator of sigma subunit)
MSTVVCEPGDALAIVSDGLTEISDQREQEIGLKPLEESFLQSCREGAPLAEIARTLRERALRHGQQTDDQTVLLIRRMGQP